MNNDNLKIILEFGKKLHELDELNYYYRYTKHKAKHEIIEGVLQEERVRPYNNVEFDRGRKAYRMGKSNLINDLKRFNGPYRQVLFLSDEEEKRIWGMFDELLNISQNIASFSTNEKVQKSTTFLIQSIKNFLHSLDNNTQITSSKAKDKINCFFNGFVKINERFCHEFKINPYLIYRFLYIALEEIRYISKYKIILNEFNDKDEFGYKSTEQEMDEVMSRNASSSSRLIFTKFNSGTQYIKGSNTFNIIENTISNIICTSLFKAFEALANLLNEVFPELDIINTDDDSKYQLNYNLEEIEKLIKEDKSIFRKTQIEGGCFDSRNELINSIHSYSKVINSDYFKKLRAVRNKIVHPNIRRGLDKRRTEDQVFIEKGALIYLSSEVEVAIMNLQRLLYQERVDIVSEYKDMVNYYKEDARAFSDIIISHFN